MRKSRIIVLLLAIVMLFSLPIEVLAADGVTLSVSTPDQLMRLSRRCRLDSWSQGITVRLLNDIDLTGYDFEPIPTFGGTFEGQGYTIRGMELKSSGSAVGGLFRYVQQSGVVRQLNVEAEIEPEANAERFGAIAGENSGRIINCSFSGKISGVSDIGGIVGLNNASGEIYGCQSKGSISGEHYTGGIAGRNLGSIINCTNFSSVNTTNVEIQPDTLTIDWENINSTENTVIHTDTGGITGFSQGILQGCTNRGFIGYPHVGYNIGGIVGRQSGYMYKCENFGEVNGRKDIGGVVGQMVPAIRMQYSVGEIAALRGEMAALESMIDKMITDFEDSSNEITGILASAGEHLDSAGNSAGVIVETLTNFVDGNVESINTLTALVSRYVDKLQPALGHLEESFGYMSSAMEQLSKTIAALEDAGEDLSHVVTLVKYSVERFSEAVDALQDAFAHIQNAITIMQEAIEGSELPGGGDSGDGSSSGGSSGDGGSGEGGSGEGTTPPGIDDILGGLIGGGETDPEMSEAISDALAEIYAATEDLEKAGGYMSDGLDNGLLPALNELEVILQNSDKITVPLQKALDYLSLASDSMSKATQELEKWVEDFSKEEPLVFENLGEEFSEETSRLESSMAGLGEDMDHLNNAISSATTTISDDLRQVNDQFFRVMDHFLAILDGTESEESIYEDMSEDELFSVQEGKAEACANRGKVAGDVNVGGIVGTIAIEYDLDPEEDVSVSGTKNSEFKYFMNAALLDGKNYGTVSCKKDAAGGAVGYMDLGIAFGCENYGSVSSTSGDYVGGIAGQSSATLKYCWSLCELSGRNYVGGIAGSGTDISDCRSIVKASAAGGWCGAIAGEALGKVSGNFFVDKNQGGIDAISYAGRAEPQAYSEFILAENLPEEFLDFNLAFVAGNITVARIQFNYGDSFDTQTIPEVPQKEGYVGEWEEFDFSNLTFSDVVEAVYTPYDTVVAVEEREGSRAVVLLEGTFVPGSVPKIIPSENVEPPAQLGTVLDVQTVAAEGSVDSQYHVRYLAPIEAENVIIYIYRDGSWHLTETRAEGSYLIFEAEGDTVSFAAIELEKEFPVMEVAAASGAVLLIAILLIIRKIYKNRKAKKSAS